MATWGKRAAGSPPQPTSSSTRRQAAAARSSGDRRRHAWRSLLGLTMTDYNNQDSGTPITNSVTVAAMSDLSGSEPGRAIEVEGLVKQFKKGPRAVDGIDLHVDAGEIYGFLGPNGAGKSTTVLMLTTLLPLTGGSARVGGFDVATQGGQVREQIGAALQEAALDPHLTAREHMRLQTALHGVPKAERRRARRRADRARRARRGGRSPGRRLLGRDAPPARPRAGARPPPAHPLPRRADDRARPAEPQLALGGGRAPRRRRGHDRLPDHPVPRGGRPARRPRRDHRPRQDRRRGHARRSSSPRSASPRVEATPADPADRDRLVEVMCRFGAGGEQLERRRRGLGPPRARPRRPPGRRPRARRRRASSSPTCSSTRRRSTTSSSTRPAASSRAPARSEGEARRRARGRSRREHARAAGAGLRGRPPLVPALDPPAGDDRPVADLPAVPARGEHRRARRDHRHPRLPDRLLPELRARGAVHPGRRSSPCSTRAPTSPPTSRPASSTGSR